MRRAGLPPALWWLFAASVALRFGLAMAHAAPWILDDELLHVELARALGDDLFGGGDLVHRRAGSPLNRPLYIAMLAPIVAWIDDPFRMLTAVRACNAVLMSSVVFPAFLLARRHLATIGALGVASASVLLPSMAYSAAVMTENVFYPLFVLALLAQVRAVERPTASRQLLALAATGLAVSARVQAIVLLPSLFLSYAVAWGIQRRRADAASESVAGVRLVGIKGFLAAHRASLLVAGGGLVVVALAWWQLRPQEAVGGAAEHLLYRKLTEPFFWTRVPGRIVAHAGGLVLATGVVPVLAFLFTVSRDLVRGSAAERATTVVGTCACVGTLALVSVYAAFVQEHRVLERNLFVLAPVLFLALGRWRWLAPAPVSKASPGGRAQRFSKGTLILALVVALLPFGVLLGRTDGSSTTTLSLTAIRSLGADVGPAGAPVGAVLAVAACLMALRSTAARRLVPMLVSLFLVVTTAATARTTIGLAREMHDAGVVGGRLDWLDALVPKLHSPEGGPRRASFVWTGVESRPLLWMTQFYNRSFSEVLRILERDWPDRLATVPFLVEVETGLALGRGNVPLESELVAVHPSVELAAERCFEDPSGRIVLYRVDGLLRWSGVTSGIDEDGWTRREFQVLRHGSTPGWLLVRLASSAELFDRPQTVLWSYGGDEAIGEFTLAPGEERTFVLPVQQMAAGSFVLRFLATRTEVPARRSRSTDTRELGVRFLGVEYLEGGHSPEVRLLERVLPVDEGSSTTVQELVVLGSGSVVVELDVEEGLSVAREADFVPIAVDLEGEALAVERVRPDGRTFAIALVLGPKGRAHLALSGSTCVGARVRSVEMPEGVSR